MQTSWSSTKSLARSCTWVRTPTIINTGCRMSGLRVTLWRKMWRYWWLKIFSWPDNVHWQPRTCWNRSRGDPEKYREVWSTSALKKGWERWDCLAWRTEIAGENILDRAFQYITEHCKKHADRFFDKACSDRTKDSGFQLKEGMFRVDITKKFFTVRVVRHWNRLPREPVGAHHLNSSRSGWMGLWATWSTWEVSLLMIGNWN